MMANLTDAPWTTYCIRDVVSVAIRYDNNNGNGAVRSFRSGVFFLTAPGRSTKGNDFNLFSRKLSTNGPGGLKGGIRPGPRSTNNTLSHPVILSPGLRTAHSPRGTY